MLYVVIDDSLSCRRRGIIFWIFFWSFKFMYMSIFCTSKRLCITIHYNRESISVSLLPLQKKYFLFLLVTPGPFTEIKKYFSPSVTMSKNNNSNTCFTLRECVKIVKDLVSSYEGRKTSFLVPKSFGIMAKFIRSWIAKLRKASKISLGSN